MHEYQKPIFQAWGKNLIVFEVDYATKLQLKKAGWSDAKIRSCLRVSAQKANDSIRKIMVTK